jgi:hypothetical protein
VPFDDPSVWCQQNNRWKDTSVTALPAGAVNADRWVGAIVTVVTGKVMGEIIRFTWTAARSSPSLAG